MKRMLFASLLFIPFISSFAAEDNTLVVHMSEVVKSGTGTPVGTVDIKQTPQGVLFIPHLHGLVPGVHGFHIHEKPSCDDMAMSAGGHYDPEQTGKHLGPYNDQGHKGDLPVLNVDKDGNATLPVLAPRLKLSDVTNRALMIHEGGDNYSDEPQKLGGGGVRMFCGIIK